MRLVLDPINPAPRRIQQIVQALAAGQVIAYPTDTVYGLGADLQSKPGIDRIYQIRQMNRQKPLSLLCASLSSIARYAQVTDAAYRLMRRLVPGPYTFVLEATKQVPSTLLRPARELASQVEGAEAARARLPKREKTVGIRVPDSPLLQAVIESLGRPLVNTSCILDGQQLQDPEEIDRRIGKQLALVVDVGLGGLEASTVLSLIGDQVEVLREGKGPVDPQW